MVAAPAPESTLPGVMSSVGVGGTTTGVTGAGVFTVTVLGVFEELINQ
jgi:hypothetical protein